MLARIIVEQEIKTNIRGSNDYFSNTRYLRLIENHYLFLYNYNWFTKTYFFLYQEWYRSFVIVPGFWKKDQFSFINDFFHLNFFTIYLIFYQSQIPCVWETIIASWNICLNFLFKTNPFHYQICSTTFILLPRMVYKFCYSSRILKKKDQFWLKNNLFHLNVETFD